VSSYGGRTKSSGVVKILKDLDRGLGGVDVLIIEDIVDTGLTLRYLLENLATRKPRSLGVCALLDKTDARIEPVEVKHVGFECPNEFVVGYGLDYQGRYRNLPHIGVLRESVYRDADT
jgi:hypoxanthine phosphoribosyltransferase